MGEDMLSLKWNNHKPAFFHLLRTLREKGCYTDVTLACGTKFFAVHRLVLMACSDFFSEVFDHTQCQKPVIVLKDIKGHELEALLDYMYLGEVDVQQVDLPGLIKAAECLRIKGLAVPDEDPTQVSKHEAQVTSERPSKRRRHDRDGRDSDRGSSHGDRHSANAIPQYSGQLVGEAVQGDMQDEGNPSNIPLPRDDNSHLHDQIPQQPDHHMSDEQDSRILDSRHLDSRHMESRHHDRLQEGHVHDVESYQHGVAEIKTEHCDLSEDMENGGLKSEVSEVRSDPITEPPGGGGDFSHFLSVEENLAHHMFQQSHQAGTSGLHRQPGRDGSSEVSAEDASINRGVGGSLYPPHMLGDVGSEAAANQSDPIPSLIHMVEGPSGESQPISMQGYSGVTNMNLHRTQNTSDRPYECIFCGRMFSHKGTLTRHIMIHTGEKPFSCQYCNFKTSRKSTLSYHMHSLHTPGGQTGVPVQSDQTEQS